MAITDVKDDLSVDRSGPMRDLVMYVMDNSFKVGPILDMFAGDAVGNSSLVSWKLYDLSQDVLHIEIEQDKCEKLRYSFTTDKVICGNTYEFIKSYSGDKFDFVFCDNPNWEHEYFNILPHLKKLVAKGGWFVHNVNLCPYGKFVNDSEWGKSRSKFYGLKDTMNMNSSDTFLKVKDKLFKYGLEVEHGRIFDRETYDGKVYAQFFCWKMM